MCDKTVLMASCCCHESVFYLANIHGTGENSALLLTLLRIIFGDIDPDQFVGVLYDMGCSLDKYVAIVS